MYRTALGRVMGLILLAVLIVVAIGVGLVLFPSRPNGQTSTTVSSSSSFSSTTSSTSPSAESTNLFSVVSPSGLELKVELNATQIESGGAIVAQIAVVNSLNKNLSLVPSYPANSIISGWNDYDFFCGNSGSLLRSILGYALFSGFYSAGNISLAGSPLQLAPPVGVSCITVANPDSIVFLPNNDSAVLFGPGNPRGILERVTIAASTESCATTSPGSWSCGPGKGLLGYWNTPGIVTFSEENGPIGSKYFRYFPPGEYTLAVKDAWNQTIYAHFEVEPAAGNPVNVVSVRGPMAPHNPAVGTVVSMTLENVGSVPVSSLNATIGFGRVFPYSFPFNVSASNPLLPGQSIQQTETLGGAGFQTGVQYPLTIIGILANGTHFSYVVQIQVVPPN